MDYSTYPRIARAALIAALVGTCAGITSAQEAPISVVIRVTEVAGIARDRAPVRVSVPLPAEASNDPNAFRVLADTGIEVPADRWAIARWHGGTEDERLPIRWLGLSFVTDAAPHEVREFTLVLGPTTVAETPFLATDEADGIRLDTGAVSLRLPHAGTSLLDDLWIDLDGTPGMDAEMIPQQHSGGLLIPNMAGSAARWQAAGATIVRNGRESAVARVDLVADRPDLAEATVWATVSRGKPWVELTLVAKAPPGGPVAEPISLVLPVRTLGDPLQMGVRRDLQAQVLEGPLAADGTLFIEATDAGWDGRLGQVRASGVLPWGQMSTLMWSTAIAADPTLPLRGLRVGGNGALWFDLMPDNASASTHARLFLDSRRRTASSASVIDFTSPLLATLPPAWYGATQALGPLPPSTSAGPGDTTTLAKALMGFMATGSGEELAAARKAAREQLAQPATAGLRDLALYARISGDHQTSDALRARAQTLSAGNAGDPLSILDTIAAWEIMGDPRLLEHARAALRRGIGAAWSADACVSAAKDAAGIAALLEATAQYVWTIRGQQRVDQAAENALFGMLDRLETCPPAHPRWADTWAYGALLAADDARQQRWTALAGTAEGARRGQ